MHQPQSTTNSQEDMSTITSDLRYEQRRRDFALPFIPYDRALSLKQNMGLCRQTYVRSFFQIDSSNYRVFAAGSTPYLLQS